MAAPKGHPRYGGRKKGTPNKNTQDLFATCEKHGLDVFGSMVKIAVETEDPILRFGFLKEIAQYLHPKRKALEVSGDMDVELAQKAQQVAELSTEEQIELLEAELKRLKGES